MYGTRSTHRDTFNDDESARKSNIRSVNHVDGNTNQTKTDDRVELITIYRLMRVIVNLEIERLLKHYDLALIQGVRTRTQIFADERHKERDRDKQNKIRPLCKTTDIYHHPPCACICLFTCCTYHWVELWLFRWPLGLQGAQSSKGVSLFTPLTGAAPVVTGVGDAAGLSPSSPPNTGHSIHV